MAYGLSNGHTTDDVTWKVKLLTTILESNSSKTVWARDFKFGVQLCMEMPSGRTNNFPWKWAWPWLRDLYNFWHTIEHISKTTWATDFKFDTRLCMGNAEQAHKKISPKSGRGLGHVTPTIFGSTVGYPSDSLASCPPLWTKNIAIMLDSCIDIVAYYFNFLAWMPSVTYCSRRLACSGHVS